MEVDLLALHQKARLPYQSKSWEFYVWQRSLRFAPERETGIRSDLRKLLASLRSDLCSLSWRS